MEGRYFYNTACHCSMELIYGICWSTVNVTKRGWTVNSQFYIPILHRYPLEHLRNMTIKIGWSFFRSQ